jgi:hypothetical protein
MSIQHYCSGGCAMSDGRFAVLSGASNGVSTPLCEALVFDDGLARWELLPPMHEARHGFVCGAVAGCVIVAGGVDLKSAEVYDEVLDRWLRLPCDLPQNSGNRCTGSALL